ncbi:hypothetical protein HanRHA438_Chr14g0669291 [Helianthus annuus]|nr:hypothetical protein HanRHA438_Chr14g0669291 [Helianthus annuus]
MFYYEKNIDVQHKRPVVQHSAAQKQAKYKKCASQINFYPKKHASLAIFVHCAP